MASFLDPLPCGPYTTPQAVLETCSAASTLGLSTTSPQLLDAIADASLMLYYWTGRTYGLCSTTIRPCVSGGCVGCCETDRIDLGLWPIVGITRVYYDGAVQDLSTFHIEEFHYLVRSDSRDPWPRCSNLWAEAEGAHDNEDDGYVFEIDIQYGIEPPSLLERATRAMACELLKDQAGGQCQLPERVTSVSRRGLSQEVASSNDLLGNNLTGIYVVDLAVKTLNPSRLQSPSFVWTPDLQRNRVGRGYT